MTRSWNLIALTMLLGLIPVGCGKDGSTPTDATSSPAEPEPITVKQVNGAFLLEFEHGNLPHPKKVDDKSEASPYLVELVFVENAKPGEASAVIIDTGKEGMAALSFVRGEKYGEHSFENVFMVASLTTEQAPVQESVLAVMIVNKANWSVDGKIRLLFPKKFENTPIQELTGKGRASVCLRLNKQYHPESNWGSNKHEVALDFSQLK